MSPYFVYRSIIIEDNQSALTSVPQLNLGSAFFISGCRPGYFEMTGYVLYTHGLRVISRKAPYGPSFHY